MIVQGYCGVFKNVAKYSSEWYAVERIDSAGMGGGGGIERVTGRMLVVVVEG